MIKFYFIFFKVIRGLELHKHYEKLLPQSSTIKEESFVPISYFNDFLVVHSYNAKMSRQNTFIEQNSSKTPMTPANSNFEPFVNEPLPNKSYPVRKLNNRNLRRQQSLSRIATKVNHQELNHLLLINKCKIRFFFFIFLDFKFF